MNKGLAGLGGALLLAVFLAYLVAPVFVPAVKHTAIGNTAAIVALAAGILLGLLSSRN